MDRRGWGTSPFSHGSRRLRDPSPGPTNREKGALHVEVRGRLRSAAALAANDPVRHAAHGAPRRPGARGRTRSNWGQGDNEQYVADMAAWIDQSNLAYELYFEFDAPDGLHELQVGQFPQGATTYQALF